jgi:hypothetical protein
LEWNWREKTEVLGERTCPSAALSTTNLIWTDPGSNHGLRSQTILETYLNLSRKSKFY